MASQADNDLAYVQSGMGDDMDTMLVFNLLRTHNLLGPCLEADLRKQNITAAQLNLLLVVRSAGQAGIPMGQIGQQLVVTKSNVTGLVDRLERGGLVQRVELPDRRVTGVVLTEGGLRMLDSVAPRHARHLSLLTDSLTTEDKRSLIRLLSKLRRGLRHSGLEARQ